MCTASRDPSKPTLTRSGWPAPECEPIGSVSESGQCRWIDGGGHEWLLTRLGDTLVVERPNARGSVMVRFADLATDELGEGIAESWVLFETPSGHLLHSSVCREVGDIDFPAAVRSPVDPANPEPPARDLGA
jgi:hypothetical protein